MRDAEAVATELEILERDYGATRVHFVDNNFNYPPEHAAAICEAIIRRGLGLGWMCNLHPRYVSEELVGLIKRAGCVFAVVGSESGSDDMLATLRRGYDADAVTRTCHWLKEAGIDHWAGLLIGGPGETPQTVEESLTWMEVLDPTSVTVWAGIRIHPHTRWLRLLVARASSMTHRFALPHLLPVTGHRTHDYGTHGRDPRCHTPTGAAMRSPGAGVRCSLDLHARLGTSAQHPRRPLHGIRPFSSL